MAWGELRLIQKWEVGDDSPTEPLTGFNRIAGGNPSRGKKDAEQSTLLNWLKVQSASQVVLGFVRRAAYRYGPKLN